MSPVTELARVRAKVIHRMPGAGDLWVFVEGGAMLLRADQVEALAGIPSWSAGESLFDADEWVTIEGHPCYPVESAVARCEAAATPAATAFLEWLADVLARLDDDALDQAQRLPGFIGSHPVDVAARMLSADLHIGVGRNGLFAFMHEAGWLNRGESDWEVTHVARRNGWLTVRRVTVPGRGGHLYPQTYVTPLGLAELRRLLVDAHHQDAPDPPAQLTLFD